MISKVACRSEENKYLYILPSIVVLQISEGFAAKRKEGKKALGVTRLSWIL
jgi:hypothetical protein